MCDNPLFLGIINTQVTPNNLSVLLAERWYKEIVKKYDKRIIDTKMLSDKDFVKQIKELVGKKRTTCCIYMCMHGKQFPRKDEPGKYDEYLKLNEKNLIIDKDFSALINSLPIVNKYMLIEVCHSGGLINDIRCDYERNIDCNSIIFSLCSKDEKCYYRKQMYMGKECTVCYYSLFLGESKINPLREPLRALDILKKYQKFNIHPKLILIQ